jgi:hypothetical protein
MYIYFDESGNLDDPYGDNNKGLFFITSLAITDSKPLKIAIKRTKKKLKLSRASVYSIKGTTSSLKFKKRFLKELNKQCEKMKENYYICNFYMNPRIVYGSLYSYKSGREIMDNVSHNPDRIKPTLYTSVCTAAVRSLLAHSQINLEKMNELFIVFNKHHHLNIEIFKPSILINLPDNIRFNAKENALGNNELLLGVDIFCIGFIRKILNNNNDWYKLFKDKILFNKKIGEIE